MNTMLIFARQAKGRRWPGSVRTMVGVPPSEPTLYSDTDFPRYPRSVRRRMGIYL